MSMYIDQIFAVGARDSLNSLSLSLCYVEEILIEFTPELQMAMFDS